MGTSEGDGTGRLDLAAGEAYGGERREGIEVGRAREALRLQSKATVMPSTPYHFWRAGFPHFRQKNFLVRPGPLFSVHAGRLLGLVPAGEELLRRLLVAPLHVAHVHHVLGVLLPVPK